MGFNEQLLSGEKCVLTKLQALNSTKIERVKQAFLKHAHPRFMKAFSHHQPFGIKQAYETEVTPLGLERLARLIKICGVLKQTKAYLLWRDRKRN